MRESLRRMWPLSHMLREVGKTLGAAALAIAAARLWQCTLLPVETGDVVRHLLYGVAVLELGPSAAGEPLAALSAAWTRASWSQLPYNYPPLALGFFTFVAALSPTVFAAKLALSALEAANAWLIARTCQSRVLGLLYGASPASIFWVSREGQFEPLQSFFALLAIFALARAPLASGFALGLAVWTKMTAAALLPWLVWRLWRAGRRELALGALGFALACVPAVALEVSHAGVSNVFRFSAPLVYNPYYWNWTADLFSWNPGWLVAVNQLASFGFVAALLALAWRSKEPLAYLAPLVFALFCKLHTNVQFWYWLFLPVLLAPIPEARARFALIAATPLVDVHAAVSLLWAPSGPPGFRGQSSVFARYLLPR
jgi:hypothetical protein